MSSFVELKRQAATYYDRFRTVSISFNDEVGQALGLIKDQICIKYRNAQRHCVLYSSSMLSACVVVTIPEEQDDWLSGKGSSLAGLRLHFRRSDDPSPLSFQIPSKVEKIEPCTPGDSRRLYFVSLVFVSKPSDDFILLFGGLVEANTNSKKRKNERVPLNADVLRRAGILAPRTIVEVEGIMRKCLLRDLAFDGVQILMAGNPLFITKKKVSLRLPLKTGETLNIPGLISRHAAIQGRRDISSFDIHFDEQTIPLRYKMMVNTFLGECKALTRPDPQSEE